MANPILTKMSAEGAVDWFQQLLAHDSVRSTFHNTQEAYEAARVADLESDKKSDKGPFLTESDLQPLVDDYLTGNSEETDHLLDQPVQSHEVSVSPVKHRKSYLSSLAKKLFLQTFTIEGLDLTAGTVTTADGVVHPYDGEKFGASMVITALLGLRNRPDSMVNGTLSISASQVWKNFRGGWFDRHSTAKYVAESVAYFTFTKFLIMVVSTLLVPVKIVHNVVKFVAQFLPSFLVNISGSMLGFSAANLKETLDSDSFGFGKKVGGFFLFTIAMILSAAVHYPLRLAAYIARAATSPLKNAELAWAFGAMFNIQGWPKLSFVLSKLMGTIALAISLAVTSIVWAIALPFTIAAVSTWIPAVSTALNTVLAYPVVANVLTAVNGAVTAAWSFLGLSSVVSTVATAAVSAGAFIGVQISSATVILAATAGLIAAPVAIFAASTVQAFSQAWVRWNSVSFAKAFFPRLHALHTQRLERKSHQLQNVDELGVASDPARLLPGNAATNLVKRGAEELGVAAVSNQDAHRHGENCHEDECVKHLLDVMLEKRFPKQKTAPAPTLDEEAEFDSLDI